MKASVTEKPSAELAVIGGKEIAARAEGLLPTGLLKRGAVAVRETRRLLLRHWRALLFIVCVVAPTALAAVYYLALASPQYVAETRFGVRFADPSKNDASSLFEGRAAASQIGLDSYAIVQYVQSREIIDQIASQIDLRAMFQRNDIDGFDRFPQGGTAEEFQSYWNSHVQSFFDLTTGSIIVSVRAFTPQDALDIAQRVKNSSEKLIGDLAQKSREDGVKLANEEVAHAQERLRAARAAMMQVRNEEAHIDPRKEAEVDLEGIGKIADQLAQVRSQLEVSRNYMDESAPSVVNLGLRERALKQQLEAAKAAMTSAAVPDAKTLTRALGKYDQAKADVDFAQDDYKSSMENLDRARMQAARTSVYLATYVEPSLPQSSTYPDRPKSIAIALLASLGVWIVIIIVGHSVSEHA